VNSSAIIDQVQANLNRSDATTTLVLQWLNNRQDQICSMDNFSFMEGDYSVNTVASTQSYVFPSRYKDELHMWLVSSTTKYYLVKWVGSEAERSYTQTDKSGKPTNYWVWNDKYWLYPIPDAVYTLKLKYYEYLADLTDTASEENDLCSYWADLLIDGATADGFHYFQQSDKAAEWETKFNNELAKLMRREGKRRYTFYSPRLKIRVR
jgi:hypothetical protein